MLYVFLVTLDNCMSHASLNSLSSFMPTHQYNRFSSTVGQAAVEEMLRLREAASSFGDTI
jgi:hypothetical protein